MLQPRHDAECLDHHRLVDPGAEFGFRGDFRRAVQIAAVDQVHVNRSQPPTRALRRARVSAIASDVASATTFAATRLDHPLVHSLVLISDDGVELMTMRLNRPPNSKRPDGALGNNRRLDRHRRPSRRLNSEMLEDRRMLHALTTGTGDGGLSVGVDGYGALGSAVGAAESRRGDL